MGENSVNAGRSFSGSVAEVGGPGRPDQTEIKNEPEQTAQVKLAETIQEFGSLADLVVHDINSSLSTITMLIEALAVPEELLPTVNRSLDRISNAVSNLKKHSMLLGLGAPLDKSQIQVNSSAPVLVVPELIEVLADKCDQYASGRVRISHRIEKTARRAFIRANGPDLRRLFSNLIDNAIAALDEKPGQIQLELRVEDDELVAVVADTGIGMSNFVRRTIAKGFTYDDSRLAGHGEGLFQVSNILKNHDGKIEIISAPNKGAKIILRFPTVPAPERTTSEIDP